MMARKNVFGPSQTSDEMPDEMPEKASATSSLARSRPLLGIERPVRHASPLGAISQSLDSINAKVRRAEEIEQQLAAGLVIVEIDPDLIDAAFILDRMESTPADHLILVESIRTHGQQVPILVRPHPEQGNRYQVAYGHRRLRAARDLGRKVRSVVRELNDEQLVVAQGQENSARTDLTFIERARFACRLEERKFTRETIMAALSVDKANLSRMISISSRIPPDVIETIGAAPGYGRQRWQELTDLLEDKANLNVVRTLIGGAEFKALSSDQRFDALFKSLKSKITRARSAPWVAEDGTRLVRITQTEKKFTLVIDKRIAPEFGEFVQCRLQQLYEEFSRRTSNT
jgi:ParB family transcriptional regulator, chromosome partitioning protein